MSIHYLILMLLGSTFFHPGREDSVSVIRMGNSNFRHYRAIHYFTWSPDGATIVASTGGSELRVWNVQTGKLVRQFRCPNDWLSSPSFSKDGSRIIVDASSKGQQIWDYHTGQHLASIKEADSLASLSSKGKWLVATISRNGWPDIGVWNVDTGKLLHRLSGHWYPIHSLNMSADGSKLISKDENESIIVWDWRRGRVVLKLDSLNGSVHTLGSSSTGNMLAIVDETDVMLWDVEKQCCIWSIPLAKIHWLLQSLPASLDSFKSNRERRLSPDGKTLAILDGAVVRLYNKKTKKELSSIIGHVAPIHAMLFLDDGRTLASWSGKSHEQALLWNIHDRKLLGEISMQQPDQRLRHSPDARMTLKEERARPILFIENLSKKARYSLPRQSRPLAISPDGRYLVLNSWEHPLQIRELTTGKIIWTSPTHWTVSHVRFSPDGQYLVCGLANGHIELLREPMLWMKAWNATTLERTPRELNEDWQLLASDNANTAFQAMGRLTRASKQTVEFLRQQSLFMNFQGTFQEQCKQWIRDLGHRRYPEREFAMRKLKEAGYFAEHALRNAKKQFKDLEVLLRVSRLLASIDLQGKTQMQLQFLRAIEVLERIGTKQAKELLNRLAKENSSDWISQEAMLSVNRLTKRER